MIGTTKRVAICAAMLALGGMSVACGDDDGGMGGTDAGRLDAGHDAGGGGDEDAGGGDEDAGQDAGQDAGPPPRAFVRLAHLISNVPGTMGAVHLCLQPPGATTQLLITQTSAGPSPVPYGGVSNYTNQLMLGPVTYTVNVYEAADVTGSTCPDVSERLFTDEVDASVLTPNEYFTIAAVGRVGGGDEEAPSLVIFADDNDEPATDTTRVRVVHGITGVPVNVDICFDADGPAGSAATGESIASDVAFVGGADTVVTLPYDERDPMTTGALLIYPRTGAAIDCADPGAPPAIAFPIPFPVPTTGVPDNITATVDAGDVVTLFLRGHAPAAAGLPTTCDPTADPDVCAATGAACHPVLMRCIHPEGPTLTPWIDDLGIER